MRPLLGVVCLLFFALSAVAQSDAGSITGIISSGDRPTVPDALIQAKNMDTGTLYKTASSSTGNYTLSQLPPGRYELSVDTLFFDPFQRRDIVIRAGQASRIDIDLGHSICLGTLGDDHDDFAAISTTRRAPPTGPAPRTPDGKPDLSGLWGTAPGDPGEAEKPEMLPWADAIAKERRENNLKDLPSARCLPGGSELLGDLFLNKIVQTPYLLVIINEYDIPGYRQVFLGGRGHPEDMEKTWTGHSIGKWEGDTLVVDTAGFNNKTWLGDGPHTEMLRITTRLRRLDSGHLEVEATFDDAGAFVKPWKRKRVFVLVTNEEIQEYICNENNQYPENAIGK